MASFAAVQFMLPWEQLHVLRSLVNRVRGDVNRAGAPELQEFERTIRLLESREMVAAPEESD